MATLRPPRIRATTVNKNKLFLNTCIKELNEGTFFITNLVDTFGVSASLFYNAVKLGYFTREKVATNKYIYRPSVKKFTFTQAYNVTLETYNDVSTSKSKPAPIETEETKPEMKVIQTSQETETTQTLQPIKFTHLQSETDEDLIAELKRRGYQGTIEIKKQVTL